MKIFITGATGFIGKNLISILRDHNVLCLTRSFKKSDYLNIKYVRGDLSDPESYLPFLKEFEPNCCVHLAWYGLPNYSLENNKKNLIYSINLIENLKKVGCKNFFGLGSCWEYGAIRNSISESDLPINPNVFATFKTSLYSILKSICNENKINLMWGRVFFVYGPGQRKTSLIPSCYFSLKNKKSFEVNNPSAINDFIYVADVVDAIKHLIELKNITGVYNIGSGKGKPVWKIVNCVASALNLPPLYDNIILSETGGWANIDRLIQCGWKPKVSLKNGILKTIKELKEFNDYS